MSIPPSLSVSVITYNSGDTLRECIKSAIESCSHITTEIFLIDNASTDGSAKMIETEFPKVRIIKNPSNLFFAAHNKAIELAAGETFLILNPDIRLSRQAVDLALARMGDSSHIVAYLPAHRLPSGDLEKVAKSKIGLRECLFAYSLMGFLVPTLRDTALKRVTAPSGEPGPVVYPEVLQDSCLFVRTSRLKQIGGYDPAMKLYFTEDDLCLRLGNKGQLIYDRGVEVFHHQSTSVKKEPPFRIRKIRFLDMLTYIRKYYGAFPYIVFLPLVYLSLLIWPLRAYVLRIMGQLGGSSDR